MFLLFQHLVYIMLDGDLRDGSTMHFTYKLIGDEC